MMARRPGPDFPPFFVQQLIHVHAQVYIGSGHAKHSCPQSLHSPWPAVGKREFWEQPFQACAIDADCAVKPDGQNSVISFVISKWLLPELSIPAAGQKDPRLWEWEWRAKWTTRSLNSFTIIISGFSLTFEVEGHWLVSSQVPCKSEGQRPEPLGGSGGMLPRKIFRT